MNSKPIKKVCECARELQAKLTEAERQRDEYKAVLQSTGLFLHHCWCDVQMNEYSFKKLNEQMEAIDAALAARGEKNGL